MTITTTTTMTELEAARLYAEWLENYDGPESPPFLCDEYDEAREVLGIDDLERRFGSDYTYELHCQGRAHPSGRDRTSQEAGHTDR